MTKTASKPKKSKKQTKYDPRPILCHPSTWIAAVLLLALLIIYGVSMYGFRTLEKKTKLESSELATFSHLVKSYINDMEFTSGDQPTIKQATGYGVSDEDDVLYVTFDFIPYAVEDGNQIPQGDMRHGIIYFKWDPERNTYGHAFSYHDDASYHPEGTYIKFDNSL